AGLAAPHGSVTMPVLVVFCAPIGSTDKNTKEKQPTNTERIAACDSSTARTSADGCGIKRINRWNGAAVHRTHLIIVLAGNDEVFQARADHHHAPEEHSPLRGRIHFIYP